MNCATSALLGLGLLGASAATMTVSREQHEVLRSTLSDDLATRYDLIASERRNHYIQGLVLGLAISYVVVMYAKVVNRFHRASLFFAVTLLTAVVYYTAMPKSDYMLNHLKTPEQNKAWLEIYNTMKSRYFYGFVLGAAAAVPMAYSFC